MVDGFHHAGVAVTDIQHAVSFYEDILGFERVGPDHPEETVETATYYWMAFGDGQWVNFAERPEVTPDLPGKLDDPHLAFRADDEELQRIKDQLETRDIDVHETEASIYFHDPFGNYLEVTHFDGPE